MATAPGRINAGAYWTLINSAAENQVGVVNAIKSLHVAYFNDTGIQGVIDQAQFNSVYGQAVANARAGREFTRAANDTEILPEMIGRLINAPVASPLGVSRPYVVYFEHIVERGGQQYTQVRASTFATGILRTKRSMLNELNSQGGDLAEEYEDETHVGIGRVWILAA